ncbi:MAG: hypothetical protein K6F23_10240 [Solobacterium sp.]|nr:hypothetical protein [Solobacterium sp.]
METRFLTYETCSEEKTRKILLCKGIPFFIAAIIVFVIGIIRILSGFGITVLITFVISALFCGLGLQPLLLWPEDNKRAYVDSILFRRFLVEKKKEGYTYTKNDIEKLRFAYDPLFKEKIIKSIHETEDAEYEKNVAKAEKKVNSLINMYDQTLKDLSQARWENLGSGLESNRTEGKFRLNGQEYVYSSIYGARLNQFMGSRTETKTNEVTEVDNTTKKHVSIGGAVVGGLVAGPIGAVAGGVALAKMKNKGNVRTNTYVTSTEVPTCNHLGVEVNINGFISEIVLIAKPIDQSNPKYANALNEAQHIISNLQYLSTLPVPENYIDVEEEPELISLSERIDQAQIEMAIIKKNVPTYEIPERYILRDVD